MGANGKPQKYHAIPTTVDGIRFASKREAKRYALLKLLAQAGEISELRLQPSFPLRVNGELVCTYVADFQYVNKSGVCIIEDSKGMRTSVYKIKRKLMRACYGIEIQEV